MSECSLESRKMLSRCPASRHEPNSNLITRSNGRRDMLGDGGLGDGILGDGGAPSFNTASHNRSGSRSPDFARSIIFCATTLLAMLPRSTSRSDIRVIS